MIVRESFRRIATFAVVGGINSMIDFGVFAMLTQAFDVPILVANTIGFILGALNSYVLNGAVTFRTGRKELLQSARITRFGMTALSTLAVSTASVAVLAPVLGPIVAKAASILLTFAVGYTLQRMLVFSTVSTHLGGPTGSVAQEG